MVNGVLGHVDLLGGFSAPASLKFSRNDGVIRKVESTPHDVGSGIEYSLYRTNDG